MNKYTIGIIDEDPDDVKDIKRTIIVNKPENVEDSQIEFYDYDIPTDVSKLSDEMVERVIDHIERGVIQILIVDYKIIINSTLIEGTEIFRRIEETVPKFPIIILSNIPKDCYKKEFVDADKVYAKDRFFKLEEAYSKEKTLNIFRKMENYVSLRAKLATKLAANLLRLETEGYSEQTLKETIETEKLLDGFCPQQQSTIEKELDITKLKEAVELLTEAKKLLGEDDET